MAKGKTITAFVKLAGQLDPSFEKVFNTAAKEMSGLQKTASSMKNLGNGIAGVGKKLTRNVTVPIVAAGAASMKMAADYETSLAKVQTIVEATGQGNANTMKSMRTEILKASSETGVAAEALTEDVYNAISAGQKAEEAVDSVKTAVKLAKAGFTDSASALDVLTTTQNAYGREVVGSFEDISNVLLTTQNLGKTTIAELSGTIGKAIPVATQYNVSLENLGATYATLTANGVKTRIATTYTTSLFGELGKTGTKVSKILKQETGKSFKELMDLGQSVGEVLQTLNKHAEKTGQQFSDLWSNKNASAAAESIMKHADQYEDFVGKMAKSNGVLKKSAETMAETTEDKMNKLKNNLKNIGVSMGTTMLDMFGPAVESLSNTISSLSEKFQGLSEGQKKWIVRIAGTVAAIGPLLVVGGKLLVFGGQIIETVTMLKSLGFATKVSKLGGVFGKVAGLAGKLWTAILGLGPTFWVVAGVIAAVIAIGVLLYKNWDKIKAKASELKEWVVTKWSELRTKTSEFFSQIPTIVSQNMERAKAWAVGKLNAIKNFFSMVLSAIVKLVIIRFVIIPNIIREKLASAASAARGALQNVKQVFVNKLTEIANWVAQKLAQIRNAFAHPITATINIAKNIKEKISKKEGKAKGGFTHGVTIAGEDPRYPVEAVLSFNPKYREENIAYWARAGRMLGASPADMANTSSRDYSKPLSPSNEAYSAKVGRALSGASVQPVTIATPNSSTRNTVNMGGITFSPTIKVEAKNGEKMKPEAILKALRDYEPEFVDFVMKAIAGREEGVYADTELY